MSLGRASAVALLLTLSAAAPAQASSTAIGFLTDNAGGGVGGDRQSVQAFDGPRPVPYAVPAGGGVITSLRETARLTTAHATGETNRVIVVRGTSPTFTVVGGATMTVFTDSYSIRSAPVRIPVAGGERLGAQTSAASSVVVGADPGQSGISRFVVLATPTADGASFTADSPSGNALMVGATVESDADGDGYGDDTQDSCPALAGIHSGPCTIDLRSSATTTPGTITAGDVSTIVASVTNGGPAVALNAHAALTVPTGLTVVSASTTGGDCSAANCDLGDIPAGATRKIFLVVRATAAGTYSVGFHPQAANPELVTANDATSVTLIVGAAPDVALSTSTAGGVVAPVTTTLPPATTAPTTTVKLCTVPSLKGKSASAAKAALTAAGCTAGSAKGSKAKTAKVTTQTIPSKVVVVAGTNVGFTLAAAKAKKSSK